MNATVQHTASGPRAWAKGIYPLEAGVELLIRTSGGRFASSVLPWIRAGEDPGWWWVDVDQLTEDNLAAYSGVETRVLGIAAALLGRRPVNLYQDIPGLDRDHCPAGAGCDRARQRQPRTQRPARARSGRPLPGQ